MKSSMDSSSVAEFLENKTIFVTGATGFVAKVFVEKVLRIQPNVKKFYLLIRAPDVSSATQRLREEILMKDLFKLQRKTMGDNLESFFFEKVTAVPGDISSENLRVQDLALREEIWSNTDIVISCAATTNFDEKYNVAFAINTLGPFNVLNFAKKCPGIKMLLHVSTGYVCGEANGLIMEKPFCMGEVLRGVYKRLDINEEKMLLDEKMNQLRLKDVKGAGLDSAMKAYGIERAKLYGWPNTYAFTKAMGEMLLGKFKDDLPFAIIRPTIITSTYKDPFPGYTEGLRTLDSYAGFSAKGKLKCNLGNPETIVDVIPVDMVVNSMIVAMLVNANQYSAKVNIYHVSSSYTNPMSIPDIIDFIFRYFNENPLMDKEGKPIRVPKLKPIASMATFRSYMALQYVFPLKVLNLVNLVCCNLFHATYNDLYRKMNLAVRIAELYKPYVLFEGIFDETNAESLRRAARNCGLDDELLNFDPRCIDWEDYFLNIHFPGLVKYVLK